MQFPNIDRYVLQGFHWFIPRYLRKHFHSVAIHQQGLRPNQVNAQDSLVIYANHSYWWDPLFAMYFANKLFHEFQFYAPIDAVALQKYRIFSRMGFFPVQQNSLSGARQFLKFGLETLARPGTSIWVTPEGRFADVRDQSALLQPGLAHLAYAIQQREGDARQRTWFLPVAIEYAFWEERLPEALARFGEPILVSPKATPLNKEQWRERITSGLRDAQQKLAVDCVARNASVFDVVLSGKSGTWRLYDLWRRGSARLRGKQLNLEHGNKLHGQ